MQFFLIVNNIICHLQMEQFACGLCLSTCLPSVEMIDWDVEQNTVYLEKCLCIVIQILLKLIPHGPVDNQ